jgi:hypothetical protein
MPNLISGFEYDIFISYHRKKEGEKRRKGEKDTRNKKNSTARPA